MNRRQTLKLLTMPVATATLSACGFNLRGTKRQTGRQLVGQVYIEGEASIVDPLRKALTAQQVEFAAFRKDADTIVFVGNEVLSRRVASVSGAGRVSEYELLHSVDLLTLRSRDDIKAGALPIEERERSPQTVSVIRDYTYDETDVLAKDDEERILRDEMNKELVRHLVLRIVAGSI